MFLGANVNPLIDEPVWQSHSDKDIFEGNCFTASGSVTEDTQFPLNNNYNQTAGQVYTFIS